MYSHRFIQSFRRSWGIFVSICLLGSVISSSAALHLVLEEDRIWLDADAVPLQEVLQRFAHVGVGVRMDLSIDVRISAQIGGADIEQTLSRILDSFGYVLIWDVMEGPLGQMTRLAEIQVFQPGQPERAKNLFEDDVLFRVMRAGDGSGVEFIADEIVIGFSSDSDSRAIRQLIRQIGGTIVESIPDLGIYRVRLPPGTNVLALVDQLRRNQLVAAVEPNYAYRLPRPDQQGERRSTPPGMASRPANPASPVAVLDSGLTHLAELDGFIVGGFNALQPDQAPADTAGHGTQMALIASGVVPPDGVAPGEGMPVLGIRTFDDNGVTSNFAMMRSILHAESEGARVLNLSWGSPVPSEFLQHSLDTAHRRGMVLVAAAGNEPVNQPLYPAAFPNVVAVSAVTSDGSPWPQSNFGDFITVAAPGTASFPVGFQGAPGTYAGTSIASAYVSHALGLFMQQNPRATPDQAVRALNAAVQTDGAEHNPHLGMGILDAAALARLLQ